MLNLLSAETRRNPFPVYERLRRAAPVLHDSGLGLWMIFDYDGVKRALTDHDAFSSRNSPDWMIFVDPPRHTTLRALVAQAFTPRSVALLERRIRELSRDLLDESIERGEMDLAADFSMPLPMRVMAALLGIDDLDRARWQRWSDAILNMSYVILDRGEASRAAAERFRAATGEMHEYLGGVLDDRRAAPRDDLLTRLLHAEVDGQRLTDLEILGFFQLLLVAGQETTTNLINSAVLCLLEHPDQLARLRAAPSLLPSAIEEVLRYRSPLQWIFRTTTRDVELHDQRLPAGAFVLTMIGSANHDPRHFHHPGRFDIAREPNLHLAFGHGVHFCLGAPLARLEARIALADLLERLHGLRRADDEPWEPRQGLHVHGPARLPIRFEPGRRAKRPM